MQTYGHKIGDSVQEASLACEGLGSHLEQRFVVGATRPANTSIGESKIAEREVARAQGKALRACSFTASIAPQIGAK